MNILREDVKTPEFEAFKLIYDNKLPPYLQEKLVEKIISDLLKEEMESTILYQFDKFFLKTDYAIKKDLYSVYHDQDKEKILNFLKSKEWYQDYIWRCVQAAINAIKHIGDETALHETYMKFGFGSGSIIETVEPYIERNAEEWAIKCQEGA